MKNLINKIFSTNPEENENEMQNFKKEYNLQSGIFGICPSTISVYWKLLTLDRYQLSWRYISEMSVCNFILGL